METIFGGLVEFKSKEELNELLEKLNPENTYKLIDVALKYAQRSGVFSFEESFVVYKTLSNLKVAIDQVNQLQSYINAHQEEIKSKGVSNEGNNLPTNDYHGHTHN